MEEPKHLFHAFGLAHLTVIFLTITLPFVLAAVWLWGRGRVSSALVATTAFLVGAWWPAPDLWVGAAAIGAWTPVQAVLSRVLNTLLMQAARAA